ncbi:MAG: cysteine desulfurase NifS [Proteobacteria bacterium]|nr:cysteine desulfurase NifS [Pseudomonadota bacterium]
MNDKVIYMDNNATTRVADEVFEEMKPYLTELYGNPSSMHTFGGQVGKKVAEARDRVMKLIAAEYDTEVIFTSCGTESNSTAIFSALQVFPDRKEIITTRVEHPAILSLAPYLEKQGIAVVQLKVDSDGRLDMDEYAHFLNENTALVSIMTANNETGVIFPVEEMARMAKEKGVLFHTDAVQAAGKIPIDMRESAIDMLSLSGHKVHAPKGVGALYVRRGTRFRPFLRGGHQERNRRAGTENVASIIAMGKAVEIAVAHLGEEAGRVREMRDRLEKGIIEAIPRAFINGDIENRLPNTTNISFEFVEGEGILLLLNDLGIAASSGSACTSGSLEPSHVLRAMGVPFTAAHGSIRFSLSRYNSMDEVEYVIKNLPPIIEKLRSISPFWKDGAPIAEFDPQYK